MFQAVQLYPDGLRGVFKSSGKLSLTQTSGHIEPLLPPVRHPLVCLQGLKGKTLNLEAMRHRLKKTSRTVLINMEASLFFHSPDKTISYFMDLFTKFGMPFDHIYAYKMTPTEPKKYFPKCRRNTCQRTIGSMSVSAPTRNLFSIPSI
jgi:hypothetical protein